jgi:hypothetical protein
MKRLLLVVSFGLLLGTPVTAVAQTQQQIDFYCKNGNLSMCTRATWNLPSSSASESPSAASPSPVPVASQPAPCQFVLGFARLANSISQVG